MATITVAKTTIGGFGNQAFVAQWTPMTNSGSDVGTPIENPGYADRSVQVTGTFGAGGSVRLEGSNDGTNYAALTDPQGNALDITTAKVEQIMELTRYIRPRVTAGDGTTSLTVTVMASKG
jgi:hypothetical protein